MPMTTFTAALFVGIIVPFWVYILIRVKGIFGGQGLAE